SYVAAIMDDNVLGKPTRSTRQRTAKHLIELYALDPSCTLFRLLRHFWAADPVSQPMLAFLVACARDPLLRASTPFLFTIPLGHPVAPSAIAGHLPSSPRPSVWPHRGRKQAISRASRPSDGCTRTSPQSSPPLPCYWVASAACAVHDCSSRPGLSSWIVHRRS